MHGFLLINKPTGITSFDVIRRLRQILQVRKIGHAGTLDPLATGLLLIAIGDGTKLLEYLIQHAKTYLADIKLGATSTTYDAEGEITKKNLSTHFIKGVLKREEIQEIIQKIFLGKIQQIPPKYSALKINGQKACDLVRQGKQVDLKAREVEIFRNEILNYQYPNLKLKIDCSTGTYIRSIAHDLGTALGCGAYLTALQRTRIGKYFLQDSIELDQVDASKVLPLEWGIADFPKVEFTEKEKAKLLNGLQIPFNFPTSPVNLIACLCNKKLVSIAKYSEQTKRLQPIKNFLLN